MRHSPTNQTTVDRLSAAWLSVVSLSAVWLPAVWLSAAWLSVVSLPVVMVGFVLLVMCCFCSEPAGESAGESEVFPVPVSFRVTVCRAVFSA